VRHPERPAPEPVREPEPATTPSIPEPSKREVKEDRPAVQPAPLVEQSEITVIPPPQLITQPAATAPPAQSDNPERKRQNILTRTLWTFIMIGGFIGTSLPLCM